MWWLGLASGHDYRPAPNSAPNRGWQGAVDRDRDTGCPVHTGYVSGERAFSLSRSLPSALSADNVPSLFECFIGVGVEQIANLYS